MGKRFLLYRVILIVMGLVLWGGLVGTSLRAQKAKASGSAEAADKGDKAKKGGGDPLAEKYRLEKLQRRKLHQKLQRLIPDKGLRKQGFVSSSTIQVHVVQRAREEEASKPRLSMDSPLRAIDERSQRVDNENYFNALARMVQRLQKIRQKRGLPKELPAKVRLDLLFYNKLRVRMRSCDKKGRCIYVYSYTRPDLLKTIKKSVY